MPQPLSVMRIERRPPDSTSTRISVAPASSEFSSNSLTTDAGRSTTSPAAILLATLSERMRIRPIGLRWAGLPRPLRLYHDVPFFQKLSGALQQVRDIAPVLKRLTH